ncbi:MAG: ABC transporter permease [Clostridiales bacterium]|nr:ABC transporter permease [Clostridiales bacterium]
MKKHPLLRRFMKRKASVLGAVILLLFFFTALFGPLLCTQDPYQQDVTQIHKGPSAEHWFGTDYLGRDTLTRLIYGARVSLALSFSGVLSGSLIGIILGVCAGYFGKWVDTLISRLIDIMLAFPSLLLAMTIVAILGNGLFNTAVAIAVFSIPSVARMVRGVVIGLRDSQYISACKVMGEDNARIIATHIIPNAISQIIVNITLNLGTAILTASSLSFLGLGVQPPNPEWGAMLSKARDVLRYNPSEALFPGIAITLVVMSFSLVGDGLRDALDPKLKNVS